MSDSRLLHSLGIANQKLRAFIFVAFTVVMAACGGADLSREEQALELAPNVPRELVHHLISSDDSTLHHYVQRFGVPYLLDAENVLYNSFLDGSPEEYERSASILFPLTDRLRAVMREEYGFAADSVGYARCKAMTAEEGVRHRQIVRRRRSIAGSDDEIPVKIDQLVKLTREIEAMGLTSASTLGEIAELYGQMGDRLNRNKYLRVALAQSRESENPGMTSQLLGTLAGVYRNHGDIDSMKVCYEEALDIAHRYRLPNRAARIYSFYARYYYDHGRLSLANELRRQAIDVCREYKGGYHEHRYVNESMEMHAELEVWEIVARLLPRARGLAGSQLATTPSVGAWYAMNSDGVEARYRMVSGQRDAAITIFKDLAPKYKEDPRPSYYAELLYHWAAGLAMNGLYDDAVPIIEEALEIAEDGRHGGLPNMLLLRSRVALEIGDLLSAQRYLERFDQTASSWPRELRRQRHRRDILMIDLLRARGDNAAALRALNAALTRVSDLLESAEGGVEGYLWLGNDAALKTIVREMTAHDAQLSLGAELYQRELYRRIDVVTGARESSPSSATVLERFRQSGENAVSSSSEHGAIYCIYAIHDDEVWRWTCDAGRVHRDVIDVSTDDLARMVRDARKAMSTDPVDPTAPPSAELVRAVRTLARILLPNDVFHQPTGDKPIWVTADGFLRQIPFEALDVSQSADYDPLLRHRDVVYVRHVGDFPNHPDGSLPGLVVVNTSPPSFPRHRHQRKQRLDDALEEAKLVAAKFPRSNFLEGGSANKANVTELWKNASFLYVASHIVRDPDAPYLALLPLADSNSQTGPDATFLDIGDISSADLSRCEVVVLSGCSSGAPYVGRRNTGPGFGDAFLDAGAGAVVQTFWDVRDDQARQLMASFVNRWDGSKQTVIRALCDARREAMRGPHNTRHPFSWAAYSVQVNGR